jgi:hypothetical protein
LAAPVIRAEAISFVNALQTQSASLSSGRGGRWQGFDGVKASGGKTIHARVPDAAVSEREHALITSDAQLHAIRSAEAARDFALGHTETANGSGAITFWKTDGAEVTINIPSIKGIDKAIAAIRWCER